MQRLLPFAIQLRNLRSSLLCHPERSRIASSRQFCVVDGPCVFTTTLDQSFLYGVPEGVPATCQANPKNDDAVKSMAGSTVEYDCTLS